MLAVHALWSPGRGVVLWAEDGERPATASMRSLRTARPHPFAAPSSVLTGLHPGKPVNVTLLLPSRPGGPLASPELVRARPTGARAAEPVLRPWAVPALVVDVSELEDPAPEARYGASVAHLRAVAELAADLASRGKVVPTLTREGDAAFARWRPLVRGLDAAALDALVAAMPPVGRAEQVGPRDTAGADPQALVEDALAVITDTVVRDRLAAAAVPVAVLPRRARSRSAAIPVVESWLEALQRPDARVDAPDRALAELAEALAEWDGLGAGATGEGRACFRLSEVRTLHDPSDPADDPDDQTGDGTRWVLEFLLQSTADPSLLVPADQVWDGRAERLVAQPQELLLSELGRATQVLPPLAAALRQARPSRFDLDADGAAAFLTAGAPLLVEAGFGVLLPAGWDGSRRVGLTLSARSTPADRVLTRGGLGREELAQFRWAVAVGDEELSEEELTELVAAKAPLVRLRGRWVTVDAEQLRRGLEFLRKARRRSAHAPTAAEVLALAGRHPDDWAADGDVPLPVTSITAEGWVGELLAGRAEQSLTPVPTPPGFQATLRPYQQRGLSWLAFLAELGLGACLADDMGLGKTVQLLALESHERNAAPASAHPVAVPDVAWWAPGSGRPPGSRRRCGCWPTTAAAGNTERSWRRRSAPPISSSPPTPRPHATPTSWPRCAWRRLVLDEAQAVKNSRSAPARAVRRFDAEHRVALTGTPVENRLVGAVVGDGRAQPGAAGHARSRSGRATRSPWSATATRRRRGCCAASPGRTCCAG